MIRIILVLLLLFLPSTLSAEVLFSDDFDTPSESSTCADARTGYVTPSSCESDTYSEVTHYASEITPGGRTGNSHKFWRRNGLWDDIGMYGGLDKTFTSDEFANHYKELYVRFYIKIDPNWEVTSYTKLNRFWFNNVQGTSGAKEWYVNFDGVGGESPESWWDLSFRMYLGPTTESYYGSTSFEDLGLKDGGWHCLEFRVKLNTVTGGTDGGFNVWVDGESLAYENYSGEPINTAAINVGANTDDYFTTTLPPFLGNLSGTWDFPTDGWYAIEFDDYVVSTEYIGPDAEESATPTASGISISGGSGG